MGEQWLKKTLASGVSMLILLRLRNAPPEDAVAGTLQAWLKVLTYKRSWEQELDQVRFEKAFMRLAETCDHFPTPKQLLDVMPKRVQKELPERVLTPEQIERNAKKWAEIKAQLGGFRCNHKHASR
ncbi:hypothetical protein BMT54_01265 [Pasteurellaceae bacterium 15-036681]|nr:hypothetical protein BMT54_01265 [Pasteurellaceae bacterium 15-036681]